MKKAALIVILFTGLFFAQNRPRPGIDYFPHTGFFDFVVNALSNPWDGTTSTTLISEYNSKGWYLDSLKDLGLTNLVTDGQYHLNHLQSLRHSFFLNDMGFQWKNINWTTPPIIFTPAEYLNSLGHDEKFYPLEFGGDIAGSISGDENFGFTTPRSSGTCYWGMQPNYQPAFDATGSNVDETINSNIHSSRYAKIKSHDRGVMVWGVLPWTQLADPSLWYKMRIYLRMADVPANEEEVFTINISNWTGNTDYPQLESRRDYFQQTEIQAEAVGLTQTVMNTAISDTSDYVWFESNAFQVSQDMNLGFYIYWHGNASIYIDKITFVSTHFEELFVDSTITIDEIATTLFNRYPNGDLANSKFQSFYADEPFQLSALYRKELQSKIYQKAASVNSTTLELNGATGGVPAYFLEFERKYAKPDGGEAKRSLIYNIYPIDANTTYGQTSIQHRLDVMINYGNFGNSEDYQFSGLKRAQMAAQNFTLGDQSDDIPLIFTMGVHSEQYVTGTAGSPVYVSGPHSRRAPTWSEIFAQGNLALAYGAKGFMYYMIPTRAQPPIQSNPDKDTVWNTYGLFDAEGEVYDTSHSTMNGSVQHPDLAQIKNKRFFAVKSFISSIKPIESILLGLKWLGARSWQSTNSGTLLYENWITNVSTRYPHFGEDDDRSKTFVETGYFLEKSPPPGRIDSTKFIYLVNRRCNLQPKNSPDNLGDFPDTSYRNVKFYLNFPNSTWNNYTVTDLKTDSVYCTTKTGDVTIFLGAGEGTLLKIEPTIQSGGTLVTNETLPSGDYEVDTTLIVPDGVKLTIGAGAKLSFRNSGKLIIEDGELEVNGTENNKVEFDFGSKNWSAGNGIHAYRTPLKIKNAVIKNASCGIYSHISPGDTIDGVTIDNTHYGISLYYSYNYGADNTVIRNSQVTNSQLSGITMVGSRPVIHDNTFYNESQIGKGVNAFTNSEPWLIKSNVEHGNNKFENLNTSIYSLYSTPVLGSYNEWEYWGKNCFIDDSLSLHLVADDEDDQTTIYAYGNFWQSEKPDEFRIAIDGNYEVLYEGFTSVCSGEQNKMSKNNGGNTKKANSIESDSIKTILNRIHDLLNTGELRLARELIDGLVSGETSISCKKKAVRLLPRTYAASEIQDLITALLRIRQTGNLFKATTMILMNIDTDNMATYKQEILNSGNNKMNGAGDNNEEVMITFNSLLEEKYNPGGVIDTAGKVLPLLAYLNGNHPGSEYTKTANLLFSELPEGSTANKPLGKQHPGGRKPETVVYEYNLYNNYPNPFNPETVIKFSLKEKSSVTLTVYNITGQKVAELATGEMEKGMYEKRFNGISHSSGVYIFRLEAQSLESSDKYTKTVKAMLLK